MSRLDLVGLREVADICGVSPGTPYGWRSAGVLPPQGWTVSGSPVWERHVIETWHAERQAKRSKKLSDPAAKVAGHSNTEQ